MRALLVVAMLVLIAPWQAFAHPGRLDVDGCHTVRHRWVSKEGVVFDPGSRHCHRSLGMMKLDGSEVLAEDPKDNEEPPDHGGHKGGRVPPR